MERKSATPAADEEPCGGSEVGERGREEGGMAVHVDRDDIHAPIFFFEFQNMILPFCFVLGL